MALELTTLRCLLHLGAKMEFWTNIKGMSKGTIADRKYNDILGPSG